MSEKRFTFDDEYEFEIYDKQTKKHYDGRIGCQENLVDLLNEQQATINKNKELLKLIANACSFNKEHSVKEILRNEIRGIDTVTYESANAWHDYVLLSEFFEESYGEHWDNE